MALGFLLGGIISPPDAVAATSVLKGLRIPRRATTILEGESLVNDASSLIVFRFALAAVISGQFVMAQAMEQFAIVVVGRGHHGGLLIAHGGMYHLHRTLPTNASHRYGDDTDDTLPHVHPRREQFHGSGVLARCQRWTLPELPLTCLPGLSLAASKPTTCGPRSIFILNGLVFILIGLEMPDIVSGLSGAQIAQGITYGLLVSLLVIAIRFLWMFPAAHIPRLALREHPSKRGEVSPGWRAPTVLSWAGMRGVVSLAAALSIPETLPTGEPFPHRTTILIITFIAILVTLVGQGLRCRGWCAG